MKQIPILFSTPMVQAILDGRKTQTRRTIKPQPELRQFIGNVTGNKIEGWQIPGTDKFWQPDDAPDCSLLNCPYGKPGDVLWVRETWSSLNTDNGIEYGFKSTASNATLEAMEDYKLKWKPSIHMPKAACRLYLQITDIRVERLQDISEDDAKAEGIQPLLQSRMQVAIDGRLYRNYLNNPELFNHGLRPVDSFKSLWQTINGPESWDRNDWIWVISFKRIDKPQEV